MTKKKLQKNEMAKKNTEKESRQINIVQIEYIFPNDLLVCASSPKLKVLHITVSSKFAILDNIVKFILINICNLL